MSCSATGTIRKPLMPFCPQRGWLNSEIPPEYRCTRQVTITGRLKDIIVTSTEKIPPADMETAILRDPIFEQIMIVGERPLYLSALMPVLNSAGWEVVATTAMRKMIPMPWRATVCGRNHSGENRAPDQQIPRLCQVHRALRISEPWTVENEMLTGPQAERKKDL